ncbi:MAG: CobW family GTP-binding protein [Anaerocolumna sp.]
MITKIDVISGFLGAGKTTLIKKLLDEALKGEKIALIENEFGTVGIDGVMMKDYDIQIRELNAGCICCSIAGDFTEGLKEVLRSYKPDRVIIEPSGVSKLSDVLKGCKPFVKADTSVLNSCITVLDITKYKMYIKNFAQFYKDQITEAKTIILSRTKSVTKDKIDEVVSNIRMLNKDAVIITTDWDQLPGDKLLLAAETKTRAGLDQEFMKNETSKQALRKAPSLKTASLTYEIGTKAEDNFQVWGIETAKVFDKDKLKSILQSFPKQEGFILRGKGIIETSNQKWLQFDYVPDEINIKETTPDYIGRICVIGDKIDKEKLEKLFEI